MDAIAASRTTPASAATQAAEALDPAIVGVAHEVAQQVDPLFDREQRLLLLVEEHRDVEHVEEPAGTFDQVEVAVVDRVEGAGEDANSLTHSPLPG